jgi:hypothetical protein
MFILWCAGFGVRETRSLSKVGADVEDRLAWENAVASWMIDADR